MLKKSKPRLIKLATTDSLNVDIKTYMNLSLDELNEIHLECDTKGMIYVAQHCFLVYSGVIQKTTLHFKDKLPRYRQYCQGNRLIVEYSHALDPIQTLYIINSDSFPELKGLVCQSSKIDKRALKELVGNIPQTKTSRKNNLVKEIKIPPLEPNEYPNINKHKDGFLWTKIISNECFIIGNTRGLGFLLKHLIYNCYIEGVPGAGFHYHLSVDVDQLDDHSMNMGIYNIDFRKEKFRKDYYKYR